MWWQTLLAILCLGLLTGLEAQNLEYIIVVPKVIRPGSTLSVNVGIIRSSGPKTVEAKVIDIRARQTVQGATATVAISPGASANLELKIPSTLRSGSYNVSVGAGGVEWNSTTVQYQAKGKSVYIQTDKAIYKPGQTIKYRTFSVTPDLMAYTGAFNITIKDPKGNRIRQLLEQKDQRGVLTYELPLSSEPIQGAWKIKSCAMGDCTEKSVDIEEYVLPKFKVDLQLPSYIVDKSSLSGKVVAKYTYGKGVQGTVELTITARRWYSTMSTNKLILEIKDKSGIADFELDYKKLVGKATIGTHDTVTISVTASVKESLTGIVLNGTGSLNLHKTGVKIEILSSTTANFKPGLRYPVFVRVSQPDGRPLDSTGKSVRITMFQSGPTIRAAPVNVEKKVTGMGLVTHEFEIASAATQVRLKATLLPETKDVPSVQKNNVVPFKTVNKQTIQVSLGVNTEALKVGQTAAFKVKASNTMNSFFYIVMSKGEIVSSGVVTMGGTEKDLNLVVTRDMAPTARIVVYAAVSTQTEIVADSLEFQADGVFSKNEVSLKFAKEEVRPGNGVKLELQASPGSFVGVLAVDESVLLLRTGNDVTQSDVISDLKGFDTSEAVQNYNPWWRGAPGMMERRMRRSIMPPYSFGSSNSYKTFQNAGVKVMTNAIIFHEPFRGPVPMPGRGGIPDMVEEDRRPTGSANGAGQEESAVRKDFPETWLWTDITAGTNGKYEMDVTVPDTITSWVASAFALHPTNGLGIVAQPSTIRVFKPFFVSLKMPYSLVRGEQCQLTIVVFNYMKQPMKVRVTLKASPDFKISEMSNEIEGPIETGEHKAVEREREVVGGEDFSFSVWVIPTKLGRIPINIVAEPIGVSNGIKDEVIRSLLVKPEGERVFKNAPVLVDMSGASTDQRDIAITYPADTDGREVVKDSKLVRFSVIGDVMGPALDGIGNLLRMPTGCGEQTMLSFAPNIFILQYLKDTSRSSPSTVTKAIKYMDIGYTRELTFKRVDNSFSAFGDSDKKGSMWLTAFVVKSFNQAKRFIAATIDPVVIKQATHWMISRQDKNGGFPEPGRVIHKGMQGAASKGLALTAYVVACLHELEDANDKKLITARDQATNYLVAQLQSKTMYDPYVLAITTYALTLANHAQKDTALQRLLAKAKKEDGEMYWTQDKNEKKPPVSDQRRTYGYKAKSVDVEMTAYALMTLVLRNKIQEGIPVMKWLMGKRNAQGGFESTQDTVVGLQALAMFGAKLSWDIDLTVDIQSPTQKTFRVTKTNALTLQQFKLPDTTSLVKFKVTGKGTGMVQVDYAYNVKGENVTGSKLQMDVKEVTQNNNNEIKVKSCVKYTGEGGTGMSVMEISVLSGYVPILDKKPPKPIKRWEMNEDEDKRVVAVYVDEFTKDNLCVEVLQRKVEEIKNVQPGRVVAYSYYNKEEISSTEYHTQASPPRKNCPVEPCSAAPPMTSAGILLLSLFALTASLANFL